MEELLKKHPTLMDYPHLVCSREIETPDMIQDGKEIECLLSERDKLFLEFERGLSVYELNELITIMSRGADVIPYESIKSIKKTTGRNVIVIMGDLEKIIVPSLKEYVGFEIPREAHDSVREGNAFWLNVDYWQILVNIATHRWSHDDVLEDLKVYKRVTRS
jgi:hypothetical protein